MSLPSVLPSGYIAVYGLGEIINTESAGLAIPYNDKWRFGSVYQVWDGGAPYIYGGDMVRFNKDEILLVEYYGGAPYTILPARLVTKVLPPL